jgi:hypothetical protein
MAVVSFTAWPPFHPADIPWYLLHNRLGAVEESLLPLPGIEPRCLGHPGRLPFGPEDGASSPALGTTQPPIQ